MIKRPTIVLTLAMFLLAAMVACGGETDNGGSATPVCVVLYDKSMTTRAAEVQDFYLDQSEPVVQSCSVDEAVLHGDVITSNSLSAASQPISPTLELLKPRHNELYDEPVRDELVAGALAEIKALLESVAPQSSGTDILGALASVEQLLGEDHDVTLVLFTDAVQVSPELDLSNDALDDAGIKKILGRLGRDGLVPDLHGFRVYMIGVGIGPKHVSVSRNLGIADFWEQFFKSSGAELVSYGRSLVEFP